MRVFVPAYLRGPGRLNRASRQGPSIHLLQASYRKNYSSTSTPDGLSSKLLLSIKGQGPSLPSYKELSTTQESARSAFLAWKKNPDSGPPPQPIVFAFTPSPVFTLGRRMHEADISGSERAAILADLQCSWPARPAVSVLKPQILPSTRGGLMTYHGPGQIVLWPTIDLHSPRHRHFSVRGYARLLENTTQNVLRSVCGIATELDEHEPGVWIGANTRDSRLRKIAAMGVHLRRHISGLGVAVNMDVPVTGSAESNPWARFVPCGIRDRAVTSVQMEMGERWNRSVAETFPRKWAEEFAKRLDLEIVEEVEV